MKGVQLGVVQETLLLPLAARALDVQSKNPILNDKKALELYLQIVSNPIHYKKYLSKIGIVAMCERALIMDNAIRKFVRQNPKGKVLNIGVGLETAFFRLGKPKVEWFDLDLPDSMNLRKKLLPIKNKNVHSIAKSMFDETWLNDVGNIQNGLFITVPGVFPYFDEQHIKQFFNTFAPKLKGAQIIFDVTSNMGRFFVGQRIKQAGMKSATLDWGITDPKEMEQWNEHLEHTASYFFLQHPSIKNSANPLDRLISWNNRFFKIGQVFQFRFV